MSVCVFLYACSGFAVRYLLRSKVLESLKQKNLKIVILSDNADEESFRQTFNSKNIFFEKVQYKKYENYSIMDVGCGNGWVVRKFQKHQLCKEAHGLDGAHNMIKKAREIDSHGTYFNENIEIWNPIQKYDIIFSMETKYDYQKRKSESLFNAN